MDKITDRLISLSDSLDKAGNLKCANLVDGLIKNRAAIKVAQYVGVIGYVLKQNRAMGNCIRKKRVASDSSMQEVVMECLSEYQDGQSYGNNDWTAKYAQVIEQTPEYFESSCMDFLETIAEENKIGEYVKQMEDTNKTLEANDFKKTIVARVLEDLEMLLKEGDVDHRPFKVAAPQSDRSFWSRFWSPSWTRRGKDKDTQYEMDNVSESLANISSNVQQMRSNVSRLRYLARTLPNEELVKNINSLSATDWNETIGRMQNLSQMLNSLRQQNPSAEIFQTAEVLSDLASNVQNIYDQGSRIQRNMYNLRLRDPIKGRGSNPAATNEYADLERALSRLYANPLDEKSLYYSHKLHGRLEDTLNMRLTQDDSGYGQWLNEPVNPPHEVPGVSTPEMGETGRTENPAIPRDSVIDNLKRMNERDRGDLVARLRNMTTTAIDPESREVIETLITNLQDSYANMTPTPVSEVVPPPENKLKPYDPRTFGEVDWDEVEDPLEKSLIANVNAKTLQKVAEEIEPLDADLAKLLREYLKEEDLLPDFPETSPILKDEAASRLKITQKKGGKVVFNT